MQAQNQYNRPWPKLAFLTTQTLVKVNPMAFRERLAARQHQHQRFDLSHIASHINSRIKSVVLLSGALPYAAHEIILSAVPHDATPASSRALTGTASHLVISTVAKGTRLMSIDLPYYGSCLRKMSRDRTRRQRSSWLINLEVLARYCRPRSRPKQVSIKACFVNLRTRTS